jgi:hypothetical protein
VQVSFEHIRVHGVHQVPSTDLGGRLPGGVGLVGILMPHRLAYFGQRLVNQAFILVNKWGNLMMSSALMGAHNFMIFNCFLEAEPGIEPRYTALQAAA